MGRSAMKGRRARLGCSLALSGVFLWVGALSPGFAEVSVRAASHNERCHEVLAMSIVEDADPVGRSMWHVFREPGSGSRRIVNPEGEKKGDGGPHTVIDIEVCGVKFTWAGRRPGGRTDVALLEERAGQLGEPEYLTDSPEEELDPRMTLDEAGGLHVVWWLEGPTASVFLLSRLPDAGTWGALRQISALDEQASRPTVLVDGEGRLHVAYEVRDPLVSGRKVVVASLGDEGDVDRERVAEAEAEWVDPQLHRAGERVWLDWRHDEETFGYSRFVDGNWTEPQFVLSHGPSWVEVEQTRKQIQQRVMRDAAVE